MLGQRNGFIGKIASDFDAKSQCAGPRSVILYFSFISLLKPLISFPELPVIMQSSTSDADVRF